MTALYWQGEPAVLKDNALSGKLSATNLTWIVVSLDPVFRDKKPVTNCLIRGTRCSIVYCCSCLVGLLSYVYLLYCVGIAFFLL